MAGQSADAGLANIDDLNLNLHPDLSNLGAATSSASASVSAPVTFTAGSKQIMSGSSSADSSNLFKIMVTIGAVAAVIYYARGRK